MSCFQSTQFSIYKMFRRAPNIHQELFSKFAVALLSEGADGFLFAESLVGPVESQVTRVRYGYIAARMGAG